MLILVSNMSALLRRGRAGLLRLTGLFRTRRNELDLSDELESNLALHIADNLRAGMTPQDARRQALIKLGGIEPAKELYRDRRGIPVLETTLQDLRHGIRTMRKDLGFTSVAVATLALGVAVNTTIFSMVSGILLRKPPVRDPNRIMIVAAANKSNQTMHYVVAPDFVDWTEQSHAFEQMAASTSGDVTLTGGIEPKWVAGLRVTANYFQTLGVSPAMGRAFLTEECRPGHGRVVILSHRLWLSHFNADPAIIGKSVSVDGERYTVIGIMPARFRLTTFDAALWTPLIFTPQQLSPSGRSKLILSVLARLKPGVSPQQAQAEMTAIAQRLEDRYPETNKDRTARVMPLQEFMILDANVRPALLLLMGAVVFVLLIACANIANLILARNAARQRELVIRAAVGAGRLRLVRQLLTESLLLGVMGAAIGLLLAVLGMELLRSRLTWNDYVQVMASEMKLDLPVLGFCIAISLFAAVVFSLIPALQASRLDLNAVMNEGAWGGSGGVARRRMRSAFVVSEIALSLVLLVGSGIMVQALLVEMRQSVGFDPSSVLTADVRVSGTKYQEPRQQAAFFRDLVAGARNLPTVKSASVTAVLPLSGSAGRISFQFEGQSALPKDLELKARYYVAGPAYFEALGIPMLRGRGFLESDTNKSPLVVVVNETFAQRFFPHQDPIGRPILIDDGRPGTENWGRIVGVAGPVRDFPGQENFEPQVYESFLQQPQAAMTLVVRVRSDPAAAAPLLRQAICSIDRDQPIGAIRTMISVVRDALAGDQLMGWLMGSFAGLALLLTAVGIFGVIAYNVAQRTREVGIRIALGAGKSDVLRLVVRQSLLLTGLGVALGLLGAFPLPNLLGSMFSGLLGSPTPILVTVTILVAFVSLVAGYVPARRATRVEPVVALRHE